MIFIKHASGAPVSPFGDRMPCIGTASYGGHVPLQVTSKPRAHTGEGRQGEEQGWGVMAG